MQGRKRSRLKYAGGKGAVRHFKVEKINILRRKRCRWKSEGVEGANAAVKEKKVQVEMGRRTNSRCNYEGGKV